MPSPMPAMAHHSPGPADQLGAAKPAFGTAALATTSTEHVERLRGGVDQRDPSDARDGTSGPGRTARNEPQHAADQRNDHGHHEGQRQRSRDGEAVGELRVRLRRCSEAAANATPRRRPRQPPADSGPRRSRRAGEGGTTGESSGVFVTGPARASRPAAATSTAPTRPRATAGFDCTGAPTVRTASAVRNGTAAAAATPLSSANATRRGRTAAASTAMVAMTASASAAPIPHRPSSGGGNGPSGTHRCRAARAMR